MAVVDGAISSFVVGCAMGRGAGPEETCEVVEGVSMDGAPC